MSSNQKKSEEPLRNYRVFLDHLESAITNLDFIVDLCNEVIDRTLRILKCVSDLDHELIHLINYISFMSKLDAQCDVKDLIDILYKEAMKYLSEMVRNLEYIYKFASIINDIKHSLINAERFIENRMRSLEKPLTTILSIIHELEKKNAGKAVSIKDVIEEAKKHGFSEETTKDLIDILLSLYVIYKIGNNFIKTSPI